MSESRPLPVVAAEPTNRKADFNALYEAHFDFIYRCLRRVGCRQHTRKTRSKIRSLCCIDACASCAPMLRRAVFCLGLPCASRARPDESVGASARSLGAETRDVAHEHDPFEQVSNTEAVRKLERFLEGLDEEERVAFMLTEREELTAPEIADALGVPVNTVYSRVRLARERFVRVLRAEGQRP